MHSEFHQMLETNFAAPMQANTHYTQSWKAKSLRHCKNT